MLLFVLCLISEFIELVVVGRRGKSTGVIGRTTATTAPKIGRQSVRDLARKVRIGGMALIFHRAAQTDGLTYSSSGKSNCFSVGISVK